MSFRPDSVGIRRGGKGSTVDLNSSIYLADFSIIKFASKNPKTDTIRLDTSGKFYGTLSI